LFKELSIVLSMPYFGSLVRKGEIALGRGLWDCGAVVGNSCVRARLEVD
jgi:hypothetical protein